MQLSCDRGHTFGLSIIFLHFSLFRFDHIAYAPDGLDHFDLENLIDLGTEKTDIYVNNIGFAYIILSANTLQENIPGQYNILVFQKDFQHLEFPVGKADLVVVISNLVLLFI